MIEKKFRCAAYIRVSTDEQVATGGSIDGQKENIIQRVKSQSDHTINENRHIYIDDGHSGAKDDRPALKRMMRDAQNGEFDILYVYAIDRLYRKTLGVLDTVEKLNDYGVKFKSTTQEIDTSSSFGKMILEVMAAIASLERNMIRERTIMGKKSKVKGGYFVGGGTATLGYEYYKDGRGTKVKINEEEAKIVKKIFRLYAKEGKSLGEIKKILELEGVKTKHDITYESKQTNKKKISGTWHSTTISRLLQNEMYIGYYYYGKKTKINGKVTDVPKEEWIKFECLPIIEDKSLFYKAQELLKLNKLTKNNKKNHLFAGLIRCDDCGKNYVAYPVNKGGKKYVYYQCKGTKRDNNIENYKCINPQISEIDLKQLCWNKVEETFENPEKILENYYHNGKKNEALDEYYETLKKIEKDIEDTNFGIQNLYSDIYTTTNKNDKANKEGVVKRLNEKVEGFLSAKQDIEKNIDKLEKIEQTKGNLFDLVKKYKDKFKNLNEEKKEELIKIFVDKVVLFNIDRRTGKRRIKIHYKFENNEDNTTGAEKNSQKKMVNKLNAVTCPTIGK